MRVFDWLFGVGPVTDAALSDAPKFEITTSDIDPAIFGITSYSSPIAPAPRISRAEAIQVPGVKRVRDLIAGSIGGLPLNVFSADRTESSSALLDQPEANIPRSVTMTRTVEDILFEGVAWWRVIGRDYRGFPTKVRRLDPRTVNIKKDQKVYVRRNGDAQGSVEDYVPDNELIRFDSPNDPLLTAGARAIRTCLKLDGAAAMYADSPRPLGYFSPADGADPADDEAIQGMLVDWKTARQSNADAYVPAALKYNATQFTPEQLQLADARQHAVLEIARVAGVDPEELGVSTTSRTYANQFDRRKAFLDFTLGAYVNAIQDRLSMGDVTPRGTSVTFEMDAFLRSDAKSRYEAYQIGLAVGALTPDEIRELEDRPPVATTTQEATVPVAASNQLHAVQNFADEDMELTFDAPAQTATFKVDLEARTITGLAMPYGVTAQSKGRTWSFGKGSLKYDDVSRVKFLDGHDWAKPIGRAVKLEDTDAGLLATFKVINTPAGDEALLMASESVKDGLSAGVGMGGTYDEKDGVFHAVSAPLSEISLTPCPAFDTARVTAVAASNENLKESTMADTKVTTEAEVVGPDFDDMADKIAQALIKGRIDAKPEGPAKISATEGLSVAEPLPYRFDGVRNEHDFSTDLFASLRHNDGESGQRIEKFMDAAFAVTPANVTSVNAVNQRPDLYVDQLDYAYPIWNSIYKGTLADQTPFVVPQFSASAALTADHVTGTEPALGSFSTTSQTITPTATSGKVELTREVVDAGGNPQVSGLIWNQVVRSYYEALEAKAVLMLEGLAPTAVTVTTAVADAALEGELTAALAGLSFIRGGNRFDQFMVQIDLYKKLVAAKDTTGRKLFPLLGATNSTGTVSGNFGQVMVGDLVAQPAWALAPSGIVAANSYLYNRDDVHGWATPPKRFTFEYRVSLVDLAVWGYKALACTRIEGVRRFIYDPV